MTGCEASLVEMSVFQPHHQALPQGEAEVSQPRLAILNGGEMREEDGNWKGLMEQGQL